MIKTGNVVRLRLAIKGNLSSGVYTKIAKLPTGYIPTMEILKGIVFEVTKNNGYLTVNADGDISIFTTSNYTNTNIYVDETFVI